VKNLAQLLAVLASRYGDKPPNWPTDPYLSLVWLHCGYPASDTRCAKGWESLTSQIGVDPQQIIAAKPQQLASALKPGGMVPELRAMRLKEIAERIVKQYAGDLRAGLNGRSLPQVRAALKQFPNIGDPGADRIILFAGISPVAAVPSNCPHVLVRIQLGREHENYTRTYREAQQMIEEGVPPNFDSRTRAYCFLRTMDSNCVRVQTPSAAPAPSRPTVHFQAASCEAAPIPYSENHNPLCRSPRKAA
jgi:endonuclease-3